MKYRAENLSFHLRVKGFRAVDIEELSRKKSSDVRKINDHHEKNP